MKKTLLATAIVAAMTTSALAGEEVKVGVILGFTGPIESLTPDMAASAELAFRKLPLRDNCWVVRPSSRSVKIRPVSMPLRPRPTPRP